MTGKQTSGETFAGFQHEAGDRAFVAQQHFVDFVARHPFVAERPELSTLAALADAAMAELYQAIWKADE